MDSGDILDRLRQAAELARSQGLAELHKRLIEIGADIRGLLDGHASLRDQALVSHEGALWKRRADGGFDGPFCTPCWASQGALTWLVASGSVIEEVQCPTCRRPTKLPRPPA